MDVYGGVRWSAASAWGRQAIQFVISIVLARLLLPQDYGLLAMAAVSRERDRCLIQSAVRKFW